jgi:hypothetical protein
MKIVLVLLILAAIAYLAWKYHAAIESFLPGIKTYLWNGLLTVTGIAAPLLDYLGQVDLGTVLTKENAALATIVIGIVGILLSMVTRRPCDRAEG